MRSKFKGLGAVSFALAAVGLFYATAPAMAQQKTITVWFGKGFYKSEDDALLETIKKFEAKTGIKVELSQYAIQDMIPKTVAALTPAPCLMSLTPTAMMCRRRANGPMRASSRTSPTSSCR